MKPEIRMEQRDEAIAVMEKICQYPAETIQYALAFMRGVQFGRVAAAGNAQAAKGA